MHKLIAAMWLGCAVTVPAVATDWKAELDDLAREASAPAGPQSEWREGEWLPGTGARLVDPIRPFAYRGSGWAMLDGWMRGDPLLRQWVLRGFDADGDEVLTAAEASVARHAFYSLADANRSGIITTEEFVNGWRTARDGLLGPYAVAG